MEQSPSLPRSQPPPRRRITLRRRTAPATGNPSPCGRGCTILRWPPPYGKLAAIFSRGFWTLPGTLLRRVNCSREPPRRAGPASCTTSPLISCSENSIGIPGMRFELGSCSKILMPSLELFPSRFHLKVSIFVFKCFYGDLLCGYFLLCGNCLFCDYRVKWGCIWWWGWTSNWLAKKKKKSCGNWVSEYCLYMIMWLSVV